MTFDATQLPSSHSHRSYWIAAAILGAPGLAFALWVWLDRGTPEVSPRPATSRPRGSGDAAAAAAQLEQGRSLLDEGKLQGAEEAFRAASKLAPASYAPRKALIGLLGLERRGADQEAALWDLFENASSRREQRLEALGLLARGGPVIPAETLRKDEDEGNALERAHRADPANLYVRAAFAYFLRNRGRLDGARRVLEPGLQGPGTDPWLVDEYLALLLDEGRGDEAGSLLESSKRTGFPESARRRLLKGIWQAAQGRQEEAVEAFHAAIKADPRDIEAHHRLGQALRALKKTEEARKEQVWVEAARGLRQLVDRLDYASTSPETLLKAAELCRTMGRDREAQAWRKLSSF